MVLLIISGLKLIKNYSKKIAHRKKSKPFEYTKVNNDWYNLGVMMYEMSLNLNPEDFLDKEGKLHYPRFID